MKIEISHTKQWLFFTVLFTFSSSLFAAVPKLTPAQPKQLLNKPQSSSIEMMGGNAGALFTILDVRRSTDVKKKVERVVIDLGDSKGRGLRGDVGFYHAELQADPPRLVLDIAQTPQSKLSFEEVQKRLSKSITIRQSTVMIDPITNNTNISIDLQPGTKARVFPVKGVKDSSKIVIDLIAM